MSYNDVKTAVKTQLESISTIENVQPYRRHTIDWVDVASRYQDTDGKIHVWIIEWDGVDTELQAVGSRAVSYPHKMNLWGLYGVKESVDSGDTFENEVDSVLDKFNGIKTLVLADGSTAIQPDNQLATLEKFGHQTLNDVLCHQAQITIVYEELRSYVQ